jgi:hypothetical protein
MEKAYLNKTAGFCMYIFIITHLLDLILYRIKTHLFIMFVSCYTGFIVVFLDINHPVLRDPSFGSVATL